MNTVVFMVIRDVENICPRLPTAALDGLKRWQDRRHQLESGMLHSMGKQYETVCYICPVVRQNHIQNGSI